jgi:hypothetical protein
MWFILGGQQANAVCIQDLSVFVLAIFGLGLNCIVDENADEDMFDDTEVKEIQEAFKLFYLQKQAKEEPVKRSLASTRSISTKNYKKTVIEIIEESTDRVEQDQLVHDADMIEEQQDEDEEDENEGQDHQQQSPGFERDTEPPRMGRQTTKSKADCSFQSRNPPKSYHSGTSSPMLLLDVNLGGGKVERVMMHEGDDPRVIADRIIRENNLEPHLREKFLRILQEQLH